MLGYQKKGIAMIIYGRPLEFVSDTINRAIDEFTRTNDSTMWVEFNDVRFPVHRTDEAWGKAYDRYRSSLNNKRKEGK